MQNQWGYQTSPKALLICFLRDNRKKDRVLMKITKFNIYGRIHSLYSRTHKKQETTSL
jgi:hypothetical protein